MWNLKLDISNMEYKATIKGNDTIIYDNPKISSELQMKIVESYKRLSDVWKVGEESGIRGQYVHKILTKLGVVHKMNYFTDNDRLILCELYPKYRQERKLDELASIMGRTKQFICRQAKYSGLTDRENIPKLSKEERERISKMRKTYYLSHEHPRGYLGHKHDKNARNKISESSKRTWLDPNSRFNSESFRQNVSDRMFKYRTDGVIKSKSNRKEVSTVIDWTKYVFKSSWEYEVAIRLQKLKTNGDIISWEYEPDRFIFNDIKKGIRSYCPDFKVTTPNCVFYIEVKGWKSEIGMKRLSMFKERYPNIKLYLIDETEYKNVISKTNYLRLYTKQI